MGNRGPTTTLAYLTERIDRSPKTFALDWEIREELAHPETDPEYAAGLGAFCRSLEYAWRDPSLGEILRDIPDPTDPMNSEEDDDDGYRPS